MNIAYLHAYAYAWTLPNYHARFCITGFLKKDISKLLQHKDHLLQRSGLLYTLSIMQRLVKATTAAATVGIGRAVKIEASVASVVHKLLPDFHLLLSIRSK